MIEKLAELGFTEVTDLGTKDGKTLFRIMTKRGWTYERFATVDDIDRWAQKIKSL